MVMEEHTKSLVLDRSNFVSSKRPPHFCTKQHDPRIFVWRVTTLDIDRTAAFSLRVADFSLHSGSNGLDALQPLQRTIQVHPSPCHRVLQQPVGQAPACTISCADAHSRAP